MRVAVCRLFANVTTNITKADAGSENSTAFFILILTNFLTLPSLSSAFTSSSYFIRLVYIIMIKGKISMPYTLGFKK